MEFWEVLNNHFMLSDVNAIYKHIKEEFLRYLQNYNYKYYYNKIKRNKPFTIINHKLW